MNICSLIPLPELPVILGENIPIDIKIIPKKIKLPEDALIEDYNFKVKDEVIYRFWEHIGKFKLIKGNEIHFEPAVNVDIERVRRFLIGNILAFLLHQRGFLVLHASAVNIGNKLVAFSGGVEYGKSTTAMFFYRKGYQVVADDYIPIYFKENKLPLAIPGFPKLKLSKNSILAGNFDEGDVVNTGPDIINNFVNVDNGFSERPLELDRIYFIGRSDCPIIDSLNPQEAFKNLISNTFAKKLLTKQEKVRNLQYYSYIIQNTNLKRLSTPKSFNFSTKIVKIVESDIREF